MCFKNPGIGVELRLWIELQGMGLGNHANALTGCKTGRTARRHANPREEHALSPMVAVGCYCTPANSKHHFLDRTLSPIQDLRNIHDCKSIMQRSSTNTTPHPNIFLPSPPPPTRQNKRHRNLRYFNPQPST